MNDNEYSQVKEYEKIDSEVLNVLFVCSMNKWRSPTAEKVYRNHPLLNVRSAGTSSKAQHKISIVDIRWSDCIVLMEEKHHERVRSEFREELAHTEIHVIDVEDNFEFMDPRLVEELQVQINSVLFGE